MAGKVIDTDPDICSGSIFDVFSTTRKDDSINWVKEISYDPISLVRPETRNLQFKIGPLPSFLLLNETKMQMSMRIVGQNGANIEVPADAAGQTPAKQSAGFDNLPLLLSIRSCEIRANGQLISSSDDLFGLTAYIVTILNYKRSTMDTKLEMGGFYWDADPGNTNYSTISGYRKRMQRTRGSEWVEFSSPLITPFFSINKCLLPMVQLDINLQLVNPGYIIKSGMEPDDRQNLNYEIKDPKLIFKKIETTSNFQMAFEKRLMSKSEARYELTNYVTRSFIIGAGTQVWNQPDVFASSFCPSFAIVFLSPQNISIGDTGSSVLDFSHHNVRSVKILIGDEISPSGSYTLNFANDDYLPAFRALMRDNFSAASSPIDMDDFKNHYCLFYLDLLQLECGNRSKRLANSTLSIEFHNTANGILKAFVFFASEEYLTCSSSRHWTKHF